VPCIATDHRQAKRQAASHAPQRPAGRVTERAGIPIRHLMHRDKSLFHNATQKFFPVDWTTALADQLPVGRADTSQ
jgi:hypothetical protein